MPLENNGGSGTAGSHWERVSFGNEGMTGDDFGDAVFSNFTLLLFKDSGWYEPNLRYAQPLVWAKGDGCKVMKGECVNDELSCQVNDRGCSFDYSGLSKCQ